ncbi:NAD-dependent epimerase/dehydratase family protein [Martelella lutilitoris]|uniref:NAD-dependent epimerase/dehydratase family protein n=1 Tax=Martelella lutilitoris TaxID=2583532 RepID=A0A5C4JT67_9HYPH|nr:NAD-dependent epimerase/dehydratase family protein [Martelella lutilitoris]TNB48391.1 NAD-dependent epimerase/dehydratase family protein [Martelella lutilitoris]
MASVAIIGASGMIGARLARTLIARGALGRKRLDALILSDIRKGTIEGDGTEWVTGDAAEFETIGQVVASRPDVIFHVAATAMGQADSNFAVGYHINFDTVRATVEAIRLAGDDYCPRLVHASSIGVYGAPFPALIDDTTTPRPDSSYGTQKLMSEAIIADYSRMGFLDGICLRLATIAVRPGKATHGNSGFFSNIIREPLEGRRALLPASDDVRHWLASPETAVAQLIHAAILDGPIPAEARALVMPGVSLTVEVLLAALAERAGDEMLSLIDRADPPVFGPQDFPACFSAETARRLGFPLLEEKAVDFIDGFLRSRFPA